MHISKPFTFKRTVLAENKKENDDNNNNDINHTSKKQKPTFRIPFFWKYDDHDQISQQPTTDQQRIKKPFASPLFPEENSLPPVVVGYSPNSMLRDNVNNYFRQSTSAFIQGVPKRKKHVVNAKFKTDGDVGPIRNAEYSSDQLESDSSSPHDDLAGSGSFKSAVQSQDDDEGGFPSEGLNSHYKNEISENEKSSSLQSSHASIASYNSKPVARPVLVYQDDDKEKMPARKSRFETGFSLPFRRRSRSRSEESTKSHVSENIPEWLPNSIKDNNTDKISHAPKTTSNVGPVEMENIVPQNIQPPTLLQSWNDHYRSEDTYLLTDRFGFIYDRQHYPVLPPTESNGRILDLDSLDFLFDHGESDIGKPEPAHVADGSKGLEIRGRQGLQISSLKLGGQRSRSANDVSDVATSPELSDPVDDISREDALDAVKLLLSQLTDLHDSLQRVQKARWDEFFKKINVNGNESSPMVIENGELFGVHGRALSSNKQGRAKYKEFKTLVLGGIPVVYRSKLWSECCGADGLKVPGVYDELVNSEHEIEALSQIDLDLYRTMPTNVFFGGKGPGVQKLKRVLLAFSKRNTEIGYCQGMNMIAAILLLTHATEEDAFWSFASLIENILPSGYFSPPLLTSRADQRVLKQYLRELQPKLFDHLDYLGVDIEAITFNWFLSCFTDCLPAEVLFRIWDVFMCVEGEVYLFRVALALFRISTKSIMALRTAGEVYSYMKDMASHSISIDGLIRLTDSLRHQVKLEDVLARRAHEIKELGDQLGF
ncbi:rab-GTPase-TBC domain-containing protein [Lipomyces japonicus]|uniref:rab-GTPase-TBC domain-containing protein n=1 Tax=Lipomyces japonicus TaxID=56871 RepID=UPI0034CFC41D